MVLTLSFNMWSTTKLLISYSILASWEQDATPVVVLNGVPVWIQD